MKNTTDQIGMSKGWIWKPQIAWMALLKTGYIRWGRWLIML